RVQQLLRGDGAGLGDCLSAEGLHRELRMARRNDGGGLKAQAATGERGAAFADGLVDQAFGQWGCHKRADGKRASALTKNGHIVRIAAESGNVVLYPLKCRDLIEQTVVARGTVAGLGDEIRMREESKDTEAIVHGDHDYAVLGQIGALLAG